MINHIFCPRKTTMKSIATAFVFKVFQVITFYRKIIDVVRCMNVKQNFLAEMKLVEKCSGEEKLLNYLLSGKKISTERLHNLKLVSIQHTWNFVGKISKFMYIIIEANLGHLDELGLRQFWITNELPEQRILITQVISQPFIYPTIKHRDSIQ